MGPTDITCVAGVCVVALPSRKAPVIWSTADAPSIRGWPFVAAQVPQRPLVFKVTRDMERETDSWDCPQVLPRAQIKYGRLGCGLLAPET